jgi:hypothetical protein
MHHQKLALPAEFRDDPNYAYRWINDDNSRVYDLTVEDDWDICTLKGTEAGDDDKVRRPVGTKKNGDPLYAYLVRKKKEYFDEDKRREAARVAGEEQQLLVRPPTDGSPDSATNYVTAGSSIKRGTYAP